ncbi:MAG: helix-turn-helix transcriptional regulator [Armatimonadetes bacterium]|nr:helix-turn-helix transcriptional regulator [Armatimonadota bacterium]
MSTHELSPRESQIVELAIQGLTNEGIAHKLDLSVGTVNTYWLRIRMKVGGVGRTDSVAKVIKDRADVALRAANVDRDNLTDHVAEREHTLLELRASHSLLELAMEQIKSACWATDKSLTLSIIANGEMPTSHCGVVWQTGKTVYEKFKSTDPAFPPVAAHLEALKGLETTLRLKGEFSKMVLRAMPLLDEAHEIMGTIGIMNYVEE